MTRTTHKPKPASKAYKTSAPDSARRAGIVGAYAGPADLAVNRKRYRLAKRNSFATSRGRRPVTADSIRKIESRDDET